MYSFIGIVYVIINMLHKHAQGAVALPFWVLFELVVLHCVFYVPICLIGAYTGFRKPVSYDEIFYLFILRLLYTSYFSLSL